MGVRWLPCEEQRPQFRSGNWAGRTRAGRLVVAVVITLAPEGVPCHGTSIAWVRMRSGRTWCYRLDREVRSCFPVALGGMMPWVGRRYGNQGMLSIGDGCGVVERGEKRVRMAEGLPQLPDFDDDGDDKENSPDPPAC